MQNKMNRRGIIAALLVPIPMAAAQEATETLHLANRQPVTLLATVGERSMLSLILPNNNPDSPCLTVTALGRTVTLTTQEVMDALEAKP